jgi:hypothetical protein
MKNILTVSALLLLISGNALAGGEYDRCLKEEKALKAREADECRGLRYLLNPSACFATQKSLKEYTVTGKCRKIASAEGVDVNLHPVVPEKKNSNGDTAVKAGSVNNVSTVSEVGIIGAASVKKADPEVPQQESTCERLTAENARLKDEISRLNAENENLKKTCR